MKQHHLKIMDRIKTEKGAALILSYLVLTVLFVLSTGLALSNVTELNHANRFRNETAAFWLAEASISRFIKDTTMLDGGDQTLSIGNGTVLLTKDDSNLSYRIVTATGNVNGSTRQIEVHFPALAPGAFDNAISAGGDFNLTYSPGQLDGNDKTRITGSLNESGIGVGGQFEDILEGVDAGLTTLTYPDADENGTPDEFNDFVTFNQNIINNYDASEVVYIQSDDPVSVYPSSALVDKRIVYVEGSLPGTGDVEIYFDPTWAEDQNLTIISTGSVEYVQPLQSSSSNSQLNTISWDNYTESSIHYSNHSGVNYTHAQAYYTSILGNSVTTGSVIANEGINADLFGVTKRFHYENPLDADGLPPPGFEGLIGTSGGGYSSTPNEWKEI